ncbi:MFS transporter [Actinomadura rupiterrae]|uniref:MFS transporter n=1 Tax=Actinomadura rupiterrae TaxID=559627 RepID=UPI0020A31D56|nr:MFS transporter [Actinomadura rupiterrae]MCP2336080.1 EmrB/QacA subfamily drug resistance transporter [Actinomadura rupiterrae]
MHTETSETGPTRPAAEPDPRRWKALIALALIQFMLVLDMTVVNVALPKIQHSLHFSGPGLAWVVNSYVLMAGALLLLGGRFADVYGRRLVFLIGTALFALASAVCGAAVDAPMMLVGRFGQGVGEALAAPASLGLIALMFTDPKERAKALGIWGGVAGIAGTFGTIISGLLTDLVTWRSIFYINVPVALVVLALVPRLMAESRMTRAAGARLDYPGGILAAGGLTAIVYGLLQAATHTWGAWQVLLPLIGGVVLLAVMVGWETRASEPLFPLSFFANRTRTVANVTGLFLAAAFFTYFYLLTLFEQQILDYSPLVGGLSYLPMGLAMGAGMGIGTGMTPKFGVKPLLTVGLVGSGAALLIASFIGTGSSYATGILPGMIVLGLSFGICFPTMTNAAMHAVTEQDASLASGVQNTTRMVGGALGLAALVTLALRHAATQVQHHGAQPFQALVDGYVLSFRIGAVLLVLSGIAVALLLEHVKVEPTSPLPPVPAPAEAAD